MARVCVIPGDGIGPEVIGAALRVLAASGAKVDVTEAPAGWGAFEERGSALPTATLAAARAADALLFGAVASPSHPVAGYRSPIVGLRKALDLYANIRPVTSVEPGQGGERGARPAVDLVVVRENTEGLYAGRERVEDDGNVAIAERVITRRASERIVGTACELARARAARLGRPGRVTVVHKANVLRETCGLFRGVALEVAADYPDLAVDEMLVDVAAMRLAQSPERFDVIVTTNLFGDILSDVACIWGGGLGLAASANLGHGHALFEPVHGAAPDIAGRGIANPLAALRCLAQLLAWLGAQREPALLSSAARVEAAIARVLREGPYTPDLGGDATTEEVTEAVIRALREP
jgi:homoisocitrate dehydrogenase